MKNDFRRKQSRLDFNFSGPNRTQTRNALVNNDFEKLPTYESMLSYTNRGQNCHGDNLRRGGYASREIKHSVVRRIVETFVNKQYAELQTYIATKFKSRDRNTVEICVHGLFHATRPDLDRFCEFHVDENNIIRRR